MSLLRNWKCGTTWKSGLSLLAGVMLFIGLLNPAIAAEKERIKIGGIGCLSGPNSMVGVAVRDGMETYIRYINEEKGGINGRKVDLIFEDDGYDPSRTLGAAKKLNEMDKVLAIVSTVGTPTTAAILSYMEENKVPLLLPYAYSKSVTEPPKRYIFSIITPVSEQMRIMSHYVVKKLGLKRIVAMYASDDFGFGGLEGIKKGMQEMKMQLVGEVPYETGTPDLTSQMLKARSFSPDIVFFTAMPRDIAFVLKKAYQIGWPIKVIGHDATASPKTIELATPEGAEGRLMTGNIQAFLDSDNPQIKSFKENCKKYIPGRQIQTYTLQGYVHTMIALEGVKRCGSELKREKLVSAMESIKNMKTGLVPPVTFGPDMRLGIRGIIGIAEVKGGKFVSTVPWTKAED